MSPSIIFIFLLVACLALAVSATRITILGSVYCDVCHDNTFSKYSYFLAGVDVNIECKLKRKWARSREDVSFSVNRSTDRHGMYKVEIPWVDGGVIQSLCKATLIGRRRSTTSNSNSKCNLPTATTISSHLTLRSNQTNACIYTLGAFTYRPPHRNITLCGNQTLLIGDSKFFLPYFPPYYVFPWPPLPPLPPLPPFPSFPFPTNPPSLPFPFPSVPPPRPPPPPFNFWDPNTWFPHPPPTNP